MPIDTDGYSAKLRDKVVNLRTRRLLVTDFRGSAQESDLTEPANCGGFGRIRHFTRETSQDWPPNPLPLDPACRMLGLTQRGQVRAQVFQNAACNWRCWYCFVPFNLLSGSEQHSAWFDAETLIGLYLDQPDPPPIIDLTGGQPDLVPEWVPWMMRALHNYGIADKVYLWSDDNLSTDYYWQLLSEVDQQLIAGWRLYGRVCCFKGYDHASFAFNTAAAPELFDRQFELFRRLLATNIDLYAYVTFTSPTAIGVRDAMRRFVDRLQDIAPNLPLRTVPLEIAVYSPMVPRMNSERAVSLHNQWRAIEAWNDELSSRFSSADRARNIAQILLQPR